MVEVPPVFGSLFRVFMYLLDIGTDMWNTVNIGLEKHWELFIISVAIILMPQIIWTINGLLALYR